jgi:hypothetical protein
MRHLDLADLVALAAEVSEVEMPKVLELLDTAEVSAVLVDARPPLPPHEAAAVLLAGLAAIAPLPAGNRRLALLAALHLLAVNGLEATLDPPAVDDLFAAGRDAAAGVLDGRVAARDPLEGEVRRLLAPDAQQAIGLALQRARRHRRTLVSPSDLLMGVFSQGSGPGARALGHEAGAVEVFTLPDRPLLPEGRAFALDVRKALELALRAAVTLGHPEITTGHLLLGLLDGGHAGELPDDLDPTTVRRHVLELLGPNAAEEDRLARLADRLRRTDPAVAAELDDFADVQRAGLDRLIDMVRAWRGDVFLQALAEDPTIADVVGRHRLAAAPADPRHEELAKYLSSIAKYPRLSRAEEMELGQSTRTDARRRLIESNLELVVRIARRYERQGLSVLDLIQEGNLALVRAVEHYDPTKGYRLSTFATWWVRQAITKAIADRRW